MLSVILRTEMLHIHILCASVSLGGYMGEEILLRRQVTIDTLDPDAKFIVAVDGELPCLIRFVHAMTVTAAIFGRGKRLHGDIDSDITEQREQKAC